MKAKANFSKKDFLVTLGCITFLLANIAAIGTSGRRRAKEAVCLSKLYHWGNIFQAILNDNNGYFMQGYRGPEHDGSWFAALRPYYGESVNGQDVKPHIKCCPEATESNKQSADDMSGSTFEPWGGENTWTFIHGRRGDYGSYGINTYIYNRPGTGEDFGLGYWRRPDVAAADKVPLLLDCTWVSGAPNWRNEPPLYEGAKYWSGANGTGMGTFCLNRHYGAINGLFLDFSARKIGLKELWLLKWSRLDKLGDARQNEPDWTIGTGWMVPLKDYDYVP